MADAFFRAGLIEAWGRGIERILVACREALAPEPILECDTSGFWIVFPFAPAHLEASSVTGEETPVETPVETRAETPVKRSEKGSRKGSRKGSGKGSGKGSAIAPVATPVETRVKTPVETPDLILILLDMDPGMTLSDVAEALGKSRSAVERASAKLVKAGRLRFVGARKGGHWEVLR